jgi:PAS domain S-box-containing protein
MTRSTRSAISAPDSPARLARCGVSQSMTSNPPDPRSRPEAKSPPGEPPAESARAGQEDTYRKVFDHVADAIIIHDKSTHRILDANACAIERYGYSLDELRRMTPFDLHPSDEFEVVAEKIDVKNVDAPNEYVHVAKDGRRYDVEILSDEVVYENTEAWLSIARDISDRKRADLEITRARDDALAASQHKSDFLASMSHELRTPMNGVLGMAALLLETHMTEEQREYAETIRNAGEVMLELLNELLDLSKIESGRLEIEAASFDLRQSVESVCKLLAPRAKEAGIDLCLEFARDVPEVAVGDATRIRQILTNLAGNAIKFTPEGHVTVRVSCVERDPAYCIVEIAVEDTGIGIPAERLESIFEEFSQADQTIFRRFGGTGLGLAISRRLVELMGGRLNVESAEGKGSTFSFTLPLPLAMMETTEDADRASLGEILVVQRDAESRDRIERWLASWGLETTAAANGVQALRVLSDRIQAQRPPKAAVIDYHLPDLDGASLGRAITQKSGGEVHVCLSGVGSSLRAARADSAGLSNHLPSRFEPEDLRDLLGIGAPPAGDSSRGPISGPVPTGNGSSAPESDFRAEEYGETHPCVLVVEDNELNQRVVCRMLDKLGCRVHVAPNGREALDLVETTSYHLILMDCQLPEMDGYETARRIRGLDAAHPDVPIVALTANAMAGARERCLDAGMNDHLSKPANVDEIQQALERWIPGYQPPHRET